MKTVSSVNKRPSRHRELRNAVREANRRMIECDTEIQITFGDGSSVNCPTDREITVSEVLRIIAKTEARR
jgi:hypothetical protein